MCQLNVNEVQASSDTELLSQCDRVEIRTYVYMAHTQILNIVLLSPNVTM